MRVGMGYDVHKLVEGRPLILGGVEIPHTLGLLGHSDADVLVHAIMDALLGAAALGDIGKHFPDTDPQYKGISSMKLLEHVRLLLEKNGYVGKEVITGVRAEDVCLSQASEDGQDGHFSARFQSMTGDGTMLRFQAEDADGICQAEGRMDFQENETIYLSVDSEKIYLFDKDTEKNIL